MPGLSAARSGVLELFWATDELGIIRYGLYERSVDGQLSWCDGFEQGPFDTAVEVSQWVVRTIAKRVPPSRC